MAVRHGGRSKKLRDQILKKDTKIEGVNCKYSKVIHSQSPPTVAYFFH